MNYGDKGIKQKKKLLNSATTKLGTKLGIFFIKLALVGIIALVVAGSCLVFGSFQGIIENAPDIAFRLKDLQPKYMMLIIMKYRLCHLLVPTGLMLALTRFYKSSACIYCY